MTTKGRLWASGDRYTEWTRTYEKTHEDGTVQVYKVESTRLAHPRKHQIMRTRFGIRVLDRSRHVYDSDRKLMKPRSHYWTFSESFHGGPGARGDSLGGFTTGRMTEVLERKAFDEVVAELIEKGFVQTA